LYERRLTTRIFAIPAIGYGTVDFFDDKEDHPEDRGLVTWLSCTVSFSDSHPKAKPNS